MHKGSINSCHLSSSRNSSMNLELQSVSTLKSQYEDGIRQNDALQHLLEEEVKSLRESNMRSSTIPRTLQNEIADLKRKLEESENWNKSLQSRLNELLPRAGGVGAPLDDLVRDDLVRSHDDATERLKKVCLMKSCWYFLEYESWLVSLVSVAKTIKIRVKLNLDVGFMSSEIQLL